ncbi:hypothetical protein ASD04_14965 [Devosia sp. Root436]|uniref:tape measure protein n=1 Tax=Devosia sp. Root436 TaxID=1736537 RepID=UPI0006F61007|nr:tape measure protein [Devosia sp. Root436]KQX35338.1 hypothetical protein ASD04_14965 [Devosia sp. Root436]
MATTDIERLVVSLEASITKYERAMQRAVGQTNTAAKRMENRFASMNRKLESGFVGLQRGIAVAFASAAAVRGATQLIDSATRIENSLKVAGLAGAELEQVYDRLRDSALRNAAPLESLVTLYGRIALVQNELGVSSAQIETFANGVAMALRASGQSAQEASGALMQLSQALGSGTVRAEEFSSIQEGAPTILQAAAAGIREAEGSVAKLRAIMLEGNLSSKALFDGFLAGSQILEEKVANSTLTVSQAMENLQTRLIDVARDFDKGTDASALLAEGIVNLGDGIADLAVFLDNIVGPLQTFIAGMNDGIAAAQGLANEISRITGLERFGFDAAVATNNLTGGAGLVANSSAAGRVVTRTFEMIGKTPQDEALARALAGETPPTPLTVVVDGAGPISVNDPQYRPTTGTSGGGGGKSSLDRFNEAVAAQERETAALERKTTLLAQLNPLVNDYGFAVERLNAQIELENAAKEAGLPLDEKRQQQIDTLASGYARATAEAARLAEAQGLVAESADAMGQAGRDALDTIIDGFLEGKDAGDVLNSVFKDLSKNLLNIGLNLLGGGMKAGGFNPLSFLGFAGGTANTGGRRGEARGVVHGQEAVIPLPAGGKVPVDLRLPTLPSAAAASQQLTVHVVSDDEKFSAYVTDISGRVVAQAAPQIMTASVGQANKAAPAALARYQQQRGGSDYRV